MFKDIIKLSRKLMILAVLSGSLVFVLAANSGSVKARGYDCCWQCDMLPDCDTACNINPHSPLCLSCLNEHEHCYASCDPDPNCVPD